MNISVNLTYITYASERLPLNKNLNFSRTKVSIFFGTDHTVMSENQLSAS